MVIEVNTWGGSPAFHHCAWALDMDGLGFSLDEFDEATYIGVYIDDSATESTDPEDYQWRPIGTSILDTAQAIDDLQAQMDDALADTFEADANIQGTQGASDTGLGNPNMLRRTNQGTTGWTAIGDLSLSALTDTIYDESAEPVSFVRVTCSAAGDNALTFDATALRAILGTLSDESSLTISCDVRMSDLFTIDTVAVQDADGTNAQVEFDPVDNEPVDTETMDTSGTWMQYISTAVAPGSVDESAQVLFFDLSNMPAGETLDIANLKIELGAIATPWRDTIADVKELAEDAAKTATNYLSFDPNTGLDVGYAGSSAKTRIKGDGVEVFDGDGDSAAFFGTVNNVPTSRVGYASSGHSVIDADGMRIYAGNGSTQLANIGYGEGASETGTATAPYYTFGRRISGSSAGNLSMAEGQSNTASGYCSHAEGSQTTASGTRSHAEGEFSKAIGGRSHAEGYFAEASGEYSHAEGASSEASGDCSHAEGASSEASGDYSHAEGRDTTASGYCSHVEGENSVASGRGSHAEGGGSITTYTTASGDYSHAQNHGTVAAKKAQTALGTFNIKDESTSTTHPGGESDYGKYAVIVGNGGGIGSRSNAAALDWSGNLSIVGNLTQVPVTGTITYQTDWGAYSGQAPVLKKAANVVSLNGAFAFSGTAFTSSATEVTVCTIPAGFRPPAMVGVLCQGSGTNLWMLRVNTNGNVTMSRYRNAAGTYQQVSSSSWFPFSASWIVS